MRGEEVNWWELEKVPFSINIETEKAIERGREFVHMMTECLHPTSQHNVWLVASELIVNAVEANRRVDGKFIWISYEQDGDQAVLMIQDQGQAFTHDWKLFRPNQWMGQRPPQPWEFKGRGIFLAENHCDQLIYQRCPTGMVVKARWKRCDSNMPREQSSQGCWSSVPLATS